MGGKVDFWGEYAGCVRDAGIAEDQVHWFVRWAELFARRFRGVPLRERALDDVQLFLDDLKADEGTETWQIEQARKAIGILYRQHLRMDPENMPRTRSGVASRDIVVQPHQLKALHGPLFKALSDTIRLKHFSPRTLEAYVAWLGRFITFHDMKSPRELDASHIREFLNYLATEKRVASSTQNQALNALVFFYSKVLGQEAGDFSDFVRAKTPKRVPAYLSHEQMEALLGALEMPYLLMTLLMYGAGLRVMECLQLRVCDLGFDESTIRVFGKGAKGRVAQLPTEAAELLKEHLAENKQTFEEDSAHDSGLEWANYYVFPSRGLRVDASTRTVSRTHMNRNSIQSALSAAARKAGVAANVTPHCLRHAFAAHMLEDGAHIQTIQELLGHARLSTTAIYAHPMNRPGAKPVNPLARLRSWMQKNNDGPA
jgi:site-specific recombinase XerD